MGFDPFLLILVVVIIAVAVAVNVRILLYFQQPEDSGLGVGTLSKSIIVAGFTLAWLVNLLLPIDVRNSRPTPGPLDMKALWTAAFITLAIFLAVVVPGALFYSEVEGDGLVKRKGCRVCCQLFLMLFFCIGGVAISYPFLSEATLPIVKYECNRWQAADALVTPMQLPSMACSTRTNSSISLKVGVQVYIIAVLCFFGWFFFVMFGGIGLTAVPLDLILAFVHRPRAIDESSYQQRRRLLGKAAHALLQHSEELQARDGELAPQRGWRAHRKRVAVKAEYNRFRSNVHLLEDQLEQLKLSKFHKGENLAVSVAKLVLGILFALLSLSWILHIVLCILVPQLKKGFSVRMLNALFEACESPGLYPVGVALFAVYTLYLLLCVVKGCLKFGLRVFFFFSIHPMRRNGTALNSILFNVELVLIASAAVTQFSQAAFADYARLTDAEVIFSGQLKYMNFYSWFFKNRVFIWALLVWSLLSLIYLLIRPREKAGPLHTDKKADRALAKLAGVKLGKSLADSAPESVMA